MKIGILGASGAVGRQMIQCLEESELQVDELKVFASERSAGQQILFNDEQLTLQVLKEEDLSDLDYVLGAVSNELSRQYYEMIQKTKAVYVDNSSAFRLLDEVPLVVPEINGDDALNNKGLIANPNCSTIIAMMALAPIERLSPVNEIYAATYQAVSGAGNQGIRELEDQINDLHDGKPVKTAVFHRQIAYNCIASIGSFLDNGYTSEEMKMQNEGRKILHRQDLKVTCTCVRVPVYRSHSICLNLQTQRKLELEEIYAAMEAFEGLQVFKDEVPTPLDTSDQNDVYVGRIRRDLCKENGLSLWCCGDQIRKGAAANAVGIIEYLEKKKTA